VQPGATARAGHGARRGARSNSSEHLKQINPIARGLKKTWAHGAVRRMEERPFLSITVKHYQAYYMGLFGLRNGDMEYPIIFSLIFLVVEWMS
jgi:hypothetical protein